MSNQITVNTIITNFFKQELNGKKSYNFRNHIIETKLPMYGLAEYDVLHTPGTYSREWRRMREQKEYPSNWIVREIDLMDSKEKAFMIIINKLPITLEK